MECIVGGLGNGIDIKTGNVAITPSTTVNLGTGLKAILMLGNGSLGIQIGYPGQTLQVGDPNNWYGALITDTGFTVTTYYWSGQKASYIAFLM